MLRFDFQSSYLILWFRLLLPAMACVLPTSAGAESPQDHLRFVPSAVSLPSYPGPAPSGPSAVTLILDDSTSEGSFGIGTTTARQFLWFNHFSSGVDFDLEEIWVLFPSNVDVGGPIDLVIYRDPDGDPTNGADLVDVIPEVVQYADGTTFSIYPVGQISLGQGELYLGVIPRFIISGISQPVLPAALDTDASQGRSWFALWSDDPPLAPLLPPDDQIRRIDDLAPGNWMIRGVGTQRELAEIPTLDDLGLALMGVLLLGVGVQALLRTRPLP